jgi:hypothetical protein
MQWAPEEWEDYCKRLFAARHGEQYQSVPANVRGDWGIEGYTADGVLYQCYAPQDAHSSKELYERQRNKITTDIGKLQTNLNDIAMLVAPSTLTTWVLVVPTVEDKKILTHAATKAEGVRNLGLPAIAQDFKIRVLTDNDFEAERAVFGQRIWAELPEGSSVADEEIEAIATHASTDLGPLDAKLIKLAPSSSVEEVGGLRGDVLRMYLTCKQRDEELRRYHPAIWDEWQHARTGVKATLPTAQLVSVGSPGVHMNQVISNLTVAANVAAPQLRPGDTNVLVHGTIAEWLFDCPLNFT